MIFNRRTRLQQQRDLEFATMLHEYSRDLKEMHFLRDKATGSEAERYTIMIKIAQIVFIRLGGKQKLPQQLSKTKSQEEGVENA